MLNVLKIINYFNWQLYIYIYYYFRERARKYVKDFHVILSMLIIMFSIYMSSTPRGPHNVSISMPTYLCETGKYGHLHLIFEKIKCNIFPRKFLTVLRLTLEMPVTRLALMV